MSQKIVLTEEQYILTRQTTFDVILFYTWIPFMIIFLLMMIAAYNQNMDGARFFAFLEVPALMLLVGCRTYLGKRVEKYKLDYINIYLKSLE